MRELLLTQNREEKIFQIVIHKYIYSELYKEKNSERERQKNKNKAYTEEKIEKIFRYKWEDNDKMQKKSHTQTFTCIDTMYKEWQSFQRHKIISWVRKFSTSICFAFILHAKFYGTSLFFKLQVSIVRENAKNQTKQNEKTTPPQQPDFVEINKNNTLVEIRNC